MDMLTLAMAKSYTDSQRLAYEEPAVIGKVFECVIPAGQNDIEFDVPAVMENFKFERGATYPVTINGKTVEARYECGEACHFYGDPYFELWGYEYCGQPSGSFHIEAYDPNGQGIDVDRRVSIDVDVVVKEPVVHTIEPKFTPGVLPVVEFTKSYSTRGSSNQSVSAEDNTQLNAMASAKTPFIAKINYEEGHMICVLDFASHSNYREFFHYHEQNPVHFIQTGENDWIFVGIQAP